MLTTKLLLCFTHRDTVGNIVVVCVAESVTCQYLSGIQLVTLVQDEGCPPHAADWP